MHFALLSRARIEIGSIWGGQALSSRRGPPFSPAFLGLLELQRAAIQRVPGVEKRPNLQANII
jgi:hypothetical protein